jgi:cytochrome c oxidase assembly protein subunit 15
MSDPMGDRLTLSPRAYTRVAYAALALLVLIVLSGAGVRLTGSGLGCPDWPSCSGTFLPELSTHVWIEYGNRLLSSVVGAACIAAGVLVFRVRPFRRELVRPALFLLFGVVAQGLLGAATVLLHLSWPVVIAHYLLSMALLTAGAVLVWRLHRPPAESLPSSDRPVTLATRALVAFGGVVIVAGTFATAAGPHAGGAGTGDVVERLDAFGASTLRTLIHLHGHMATAMGVAAVLLWVVALRRGAGRTLMRALTGVCLLIAAQGIVGLVQYHNALPAAVVWVHASLPAVLWVVLVWSWFAAGLPGRSAVLVRPAPGAGEVLPGGLLLHPFAVPLDAGPEEQVQQQQAERGARAHREALEPDRVGLEQVETDADEEQHRGKGVTDREHRLR